MLGATPKISEKKKKKKKKEVLKEAEAASIARLEGVEITEPLMFSSSTRQPATKKKTKKLRPKSVQQSSVEAHLEQVSLVFLDLDLAISYQSCLIYSSLWDISLVTMDLSFYHAFPLHMLIPLLVYMLSQDSCM